MEKRLKDTLKAIYEYFRTRGGTILAYSKQFVAGVWLLFLYAVSTAIVVYSLSAYQLVHAINLSNGEFTVWQIRDVHAEWKRHRDRMTSAVQEYQRVADDIAYYESNLVYIRGDLARQEAKARPIRRRITEYLRQYDISEAAIATHIIDGLPDPEGADESGQVPTFMTGPDYLSLYTEYNRLLDALAAAQAELDEATQAQATLPQRMRKLEQEISTARLGMTRALTLSGLFDTDSSAPTSDGPTGTDLTESDLEKLAQLGDYLNKYGFFQSGGFSPYAYRGLYLDDTPYSDRFSSFWHRLAFNLRSAFDAITPNFWRASILTEMPSEMLTLIVVVAMGALGGTIHLTQLYFRQRDGRPDDATDKGLWYFIFRPMLGCITALSVFILAKAGVLVVSTPGLGEPGGTLSPYFVAFLGIISGLLAESALKTIQEAGSRWFSTAQALDRERWAYGLDGQLKGNGAAKLKSQLRDLLDVPDGTLNDWIDEKKPVPGQYQTPIAAFFRLPLREIFTDLPAKRMSVVSAEN